MYSYIYIYYSMNNPKEQINLVGGVSFGSKKLNDFHKKLDKSVQLKLNAMNRQTAIQLLEIMSNPNIQQVYDGLTGTEKAELNKLNILEKYTTVKKN